MALKRNNEVLKKKKKHMGLNVTKKTVARDPRVGGISISEEKQSHEIRELLGGSKTRTGADREKFIFKQSKEIMKST